MDKSYYYNKLIRKSNMEKSYFEFKARIKEEAIETFERIERYKKLLINLESKTDYNSEEQRIMDQERIEMIKRYISELKKRSDARINLIYHG